MTPNVQGEDLPAQHYVDVLSVEGFCLFVI